MVLLHQLGHQRWSICDQELYQLLQFETILQAHHLSIHGRQGQIDHTAAQCRLILGLSQSTLLSPQALPYSCLTMLLQGSDKLRSWLHMSIPLAWGHVVQESSRTAEISAHLKSTWTNLCFAYPNRILVLIFRGNEQVVHLPTFSMNTSVGWMLQTTQLASMAIVIFL